ncbi:MAG: hypothetical protein GC165_01690 [Armatimonadetes bacterium]|nr:hypothetical protein [Armatimonadota bacterium]
MKKMPLLWLLILSIFVVGCARTSSEVTVNADGSWTRSLKLTVGKAMMEENKWNDVFTLPTDPAWKKSEEIQDQEKTTTLTRDFKLGDGPITDIIIKEKDETKLKNFVIVRKLDNGQIEYFEKIVDLKPETDKMDKEIQSYIDDLKAAMPAGKGTDDDFKAMGKKTMTKIIRLMLGPDDHLFGTMVLNPDGAARRLRMKIGQVEGQLLEEQFGDRLTKEERDDVLKKLIAKLDSRSLMKQNKPDQEQANDNQNDMVGMSVAVKLPGKIVSTNGEIDPVTGEVFWDFATLSASTDILELHAICQP